MSTLSITSTKTMTYDAAASVRAFAIVEKLASFTGTVLEATRHIGSLANARRAAYAPVAGA